MQFFCYALAVLLSLALMAGSIKHILPLDPIDAGGFVTGAWCVWLTVRQNIWNWPIGIANNIFFIALFWHSRLYADMSLQVIYIVLGVVGWYWWLHGGRNQTVLHVSRTPRTIAVALAVIVTAATAGMTVYLGHHNDSAPFLDAVTTTLSLAAQFLLTKKMLENWYLWMAVDIISVGLYISKHLYLTSALYALFLVMCVIGLREWIQSRRDEREDGAPLEPAVAHV